MLTKQLIVRTKKTLRFMCICLAVGVPIVCGVIYFQQETKNSQRTHQITTYWLPANYLVVTNTPDGERISLQTMSDFKKLTNSTSQVLVYPRANGVRYFVKFGSTLITSQEEGYEGLDSTGMIYKSFRRLEDGRVEVTYERSWSVIAWGVFFSMVGGVIIDFVALIIFGAFWYLVLDNLWYKLRSDNPKAQMIHEAWTDWHGRLDRF